MSNRMSVRIIFVSFLLMIAFSGSKVLASESKKNIGKVVYFYSPTCSSCNEVGEYLDSLAGVEIIKYNIVEKYSKSTFNKYCNYYNVEDEKRTVPIVFAGKKWISGKDKIMGQLLNSIGGTKNYVYLKPDRSNDYSEDIKNVYSKSWLASFIAGIVNGMNPCSLAMIIFLITLIVAKSKKRVIFMALTFIISKFVSFLLLGTILYRFISYFNIEKIQGYLKAIMMVIIIFLIIANASDFYNIKRGRFDKLKLQLPKGARRCNQELLKKIKKFEDTKLIYIIIFLIGIMVSMTEFLCTGQIYLISIVTIMQYVDGETYRAFFYLFIYNIGMVIPLLVISIVISKGRNVLDVSEGIVNRTVYIKILNILLLVIIFVVVAKFL